VTGKASSPLQYMPQLDSLRALAAIGVFVGHFSDENNFFVSTVPLGDLGVRMFFVLSGFLITSILLNSRTAIKKGMISRRAVLAHFYARRFLRLAPLYFVVLTLMFIYLPEARKYALWFFSYLQNIHFAIEGKFTIANHFWTLAVEEQFYLVWPFLILFLPRNLLLPTMIGVVVLGVVSRGTFLYLGMTHFSASMLTSSHFDTLGIGSLLAVLARTSDGRMHIKRGYLNAAFLSSLVLLGIVFFTKMIGMSSSIEFLLGELGAGLLFVWVIGIGMVGFRGPIGFMLNQPSLVYLGKVSYGMYVYHWFVPQIVEQTTSVVDFSFPVTSWGRFALFSVISIVFAIISWHLMERPVLGLKRMFSYDRRQVLRNLAR
jgi:peptidoglycan/LPS O-acetylase OafA/YrhL